VGISSTCDGPGACTVEVVVEQFGGFVRQPNHRVKECDL
jgi:hypothetical protein